MCGWTRRIKVNDTKCSHITFTLRSDICPRTQLKKNTPSSIELGKIPRNSVTQTYTWLKHVEQKLERLHLKGEVSWLLGNLSQLNLDYTMLLYKAVLVPIWTFTLKLWG